MDLYWKIVVATLSVINIAVTAYPRRGPPFKRVRVEQGNSTSLECSIPHKLTDNVRWFKNGREITTMKKVHITNAQLSDAGIYTCRVSGFDKSRSGHVGLIVGSAPVFIYDVEENIEFEEEVNAVMECSAKGSPKPEVFWWHDGKQIPFNDTTYIFDMKLSNRGQYICIVRNEFGYIKRGFNIVTRDCLLNIETDLKGTQPLILSPTMTWPTFDTIEGHLRVPQRESIILSCPRGFKYLRKTEVTATCERGEFRIDERSRYRFSELQCSKEVMPVVGRTRKTCLISNPYSETIKIGYRLSGKFLEVFEVCLDVNARVPLYTKHSIHYTLANIEPKERKWTKNGLVTYDVDEMYNCELQTNSISSVLSKWFHADDRCCFSKRPLVNSRDVSPGLSQMATYSTLNLVPQWSTCNSQNWESIESRVRELAKYTNVKLQAWTGTSQQLQISGHNISIYDKKSTEQPVPKYLWKVLQDPSTNASLAIIQINIPDLTLAEAYRHQFCTDICNEVYWMKSESWRDVTKGYTFCCNILEFERVLGYRDLFNSGTGKVLYDVSIVPEQYSLV